MTLRERLQDERGISPVIGVALLIAMTVILAAVIGAVVLGIGVGPADSPQATLSFETAENTSGEYNVTLVHEGGDTLDDEEINVSVTDGKADGLDEEDFSSGDRDQIASDVPEGETVTVVWEDPDGDQSTVLEEFEV